VPDLDDDDELEAALRHVYGPAAAWLDLPRIMAEIRDPQADPKEARRFWLNQPSVAADSWLEPELVTTRRRPGPLEAGAAITLGFDGSLSDDATALVACTLGPEPRLVTLGVWEQPLAAGPAERAGWVVDVDAVDAAVADAFEQYVVVLAYCDPAYWTPHIAAWAAEFGADVVREFSTARDGRIVPAAVATHTALTTGELEHDGDAALERHLQKRPHPLDALRAHASARIARNRRTRSTRQWRARSRFRRESTRSPAGSSGARAGAAADAAHVLGAIRTAQTRAPRRLESGVAATVDRRRRGRRSTAHRRTTRPAARKLAAQRAHAAELWGWYHGEQDYPVVPAKYRDQYRLLFELARTPWARLVVDTIAERLHVQGFRSGAPATDAEAWRVFQASAMNADERLVYTEALVTGTGYVSVSADGAIVPESVFEVTHEPVPGNRRQTSPPRSRSIRSTTPAANGRSSSTGPTRPTGGRRRSRSRSSAGVFPIDTGALASPEWEQVEPFVAGNPRGEVPIVPFENRATILGGGASELEDCIPLLRRIDKLTLDLLLTSTSPRSGRNGRPGSTCPKTRTPGNPSSPTKPPSTGSGSPTIPSRNSARSRRPTSGNTCALSRRAWRRSVRFRACPAHYLMQSNLANPPTAESLVSSESGLVAKVSASASADSVKAWERATALALAPGDAGVALEVVWQDAEMRNPAQVADAAVKLKRSACRSARSGSTSARRRSKSPNGRSTPRPPSSSRSPPHTDPAEWRRSRTAGIGSRRSASRPRSRHALMALLVRLPDPSTEAAFELYAAPVDAPRRRRAAALGDVRHGLRRATLAAVDRARAAVGRPGARRRRRHDELARRALARAAPARPPERGRRRAARAARRRLIRGRARHRRPARRDARRARRGGRAPAPAKSAAGEKSSGPSRANGASRSPRAAGVTIGPTPYRFTRATIARSRPCFSTSRRARRARGKRARARARARARPRRKSGPKRGPQPRADPGRPTCRPARPSARAGTPEHLGSNRPYEGAVPEVENRPLTDRPRDDPPADPPADPPEDAGTDVEALRREAAKWRRELRAAQTANDELRAELERRRVESESEQDRLVREAVEAERARLTGEFAGERLHNRLRIRAAGKLRDADDAVLHLGGTLDPDADNATIDAALDELIKQRDYLAAPAGNGASSVGLVTQGARSAAPGAGRGSHPTTGFGPAPAGTSRDRARLSRL
jgi:hypothetical protein